MTSLDLPRRYVGGDRFYDIVMPLQSMAHHSRNHLKVLCASLGYLCCSLVHVYFHSIVKGGFWGNVFLAVLCIAVYVTSVVFAWRNTSAARAEGDLLRASQGHMEKWPGRSVHWSDWLMSVLSAPSMIAMHGPGRASSFFSASFYWLFVILLCEYRTLAKRGSGKMAVVVVPMALIVIAALAYTGAARSRQRKQEEMARLQGHYQHQGPWAQGPPPPPPQQTWQQPSFQQQQPPSFQQQQQPWQQPSQQPWQQQQFSH